MPFTATICSFARCSLGSAATTAEGSRPSGPTDLAHSPHSYVLALTVTFSIFKVFLPSGVQDYVAVASSFRSGTP